MISSNFFATRTPVCRPSCGPQWIMYLKLNIYQNVNFIVANGNFIEANGNIIEANGNIIEANGNFIEANDKIIEKNRNYNFIEANGNFIEANGNCLLYIKSPFQSPVFSDHVHSNADVRIHSSGRPMISCEGNTSSVKYIFLDLHFNCMFDLIIE